MKITFANHKRLYRDLFGSPAGQKILHELIKKFYVASPTIRKGESTEDFLVREGMRQVVLYIMSQTNYDINTYLENREKNKMEIEHG